MDSSYFYEPIYDAAWYFLPLAVLLVVSRTKWFKDLIGHERSEILRKLKIPLIFSLIFISGAFIICSVNEIWTGN